MVSALFIDVIVLTKFSNKRTTNSLSKMQQFLDMNKDIIRCYKKYIRCCYLMILLIVMETWPQELWRKLQEPRRQLALKVWWKVTGFYSVPSFRALTYFVLSCRKRTKPDGWGAWPCADCWARCWPWCGAWGWLEALPAASGRLPAFLWRDWQGRNGSHIPRISGFMVGRGLGVLWLVVLVLLVLPDPPTGVELPLEVVEVVVGVALGADGRVPPAAERREVIILSIKNLKIWNSNLYHQWSPA